MKFISLLLVAVSAFGQNVNPPQASVAHHVTFGTSLPATCSPTTGDVYFLTTGQIGLYSCIGSNAWGYVGTFSGSGTFVQTFGSSATSVTVSYGVTLPDARTAVPSCWLNGTPVTPLAITGYTPTTTSMVIAFSSTSGAGACAVNTGAAAANGVQGIVGARGTYTGTFALTLADVSHNLVDVDNTDASTVTHNNFLPQVMPSPADTTISGTSGTTLCSQSLQGKLKLATCYLNAYAQTGSAQTFSFPAAYASTPVLVISGGSCGTYNPTASSSTLTLPANAAMTAETCQLAVIGQ